MKLLSYEYIENGFKPCMASDNWQVALLNYNSMQDKREIRKIERHVKTDEVFVLLSGSAVLITADCEDDESSLHTETMKIGIVYNVPIGLWHNIAMSKHAKVLIIENRDTHKGDVEYRELPERDAALLSQHLEKQIDD